MCERVTGAENLELIWEAIRLLTFVAPVAKRSLAVRSRPGTLAEALGFVLQLCFVFLLFALFPLISVERCLGLFLRNN